MLKKIKMKSIENQTTPDTGIKKISYPDGADKIKKYVAGFIEDIVQAIPSDGPDDYFLRNLYKEANRITKIIDETSLQYLRSIKDNNVLDKPFEYFVFGLMTQVNNVEKGSDNWFQKTAAVCRLSDTHFHYVRAKNDLKCMNELKTRGLIK